MFNIGDMINIVGLIPSSVFKKINIYKSYEITAIDLYKAFPITIHENGEDLCITLHNVKLVN